MSRRRPRTDFDEGVGQASASYEHRPELCRRRERGADRQGDLLIVASASGESLFPVAIAKKAKQFGATVLYLGCTPASSADELADLHVLLRGRTKFTPPGDPVSVQPMSTLFEQQLYLLCDMITLKIMDRLGWDEATVKARHANLE